MEVIVAIIAVIIVGSLIYGIISSSSNAIDVLDVNKDGKVDQEDAKEVVKKTTRAVKKVAEQATASTRGRKPAASKTAAKKKGA